MTPSLNGLSRQEGKKDFLSKLTAWIYSVREPSSEGGYLQKRMMLNY